MLSYDSIPAANSKIWTTTIRTTTWCFNHYSIRTEFIKDKHVAEEGGGCEAEIENYHLYSASGY